MKFLELGQRQFAMDRSPAKTPRVDGSEFFDHAVDEFRRVDPVGSVKPFPQLVDVWDIRKCIGQDALFDHIDPLLLDRVLDNLVPIQQARIEFGCQLGRFVFLRSRVGAGDLEFALQVFDRRVGIRGVFEDRLAGLHTARQVVLAMFCDPFIQQAPGLGNPSLILGVEGLEEKIVRGVGDQLGEGFLTLVAQGESLEETQRFGERRGLARLSLEFRGRAGKGHDEETGEKKNRLHNCAYGWIEVLNRGVSIGLQYILDRPGPGTTATARK